jgi:hypothetical protein
MVSQVVQVAVLVTVAVSHTQAEPELLIKAMRAETLLQLQVAHLAVAVELAQLE